MSGWLFIGGSRSFAGWAEVSLAVARAKAEGLGVVTGCAKGADALAVAECVAQGVPCRVFCAGDARYALPGVVCVPHAGGLRLPWRVKLAKRTEAGVRWCAANGGVGGVVFFAGAPSPGSALTVRLLKQASLPVQVFGLPADDEVQPVLPFD